MAKTITIRTDHEYTSKGKTITVEEALAWCEKHETRTGEDGESEEPKYSPADLICYAVNRLKALNKDERRYAKGILAERRYAPRVDNVENKPRKLAALVEEVHSTQERPKEERKAPVKKAAPKPRKPARKRTPRAPKAPAAPAVEATSPNPEVGSTL